jgi:hypothetical protein
MAKLDSEDLLAAWQVLWGQLNPEWHQLFIDDPLVAQIIWYDSEFIYPSLKKYRKLSEILQEIQANTIIEDPLEEQRRREEFLAYLAEKDARRVIRERPKYIRPDPSTMPPIEFQEVTMEELRNQPGERHWW